MLQSLGPTDFTLCTGSASKLIAASHQGPDYGIPECRASSQIPLPALGFRGAIIVG